MSHPRECKSALILEDGTLFVGHSRSEHRSVCGEVVFNTSMTGYQEICTDPSYAGQIVLFTASHIGNVGANSQDNESHRPWAEGLITREMAKTSSSWRSEQSFISFLEEHQIPWMEGIDTRRLTNHLRLNGIQNGVLMIGEIKIEPALKMLQSDRFFSPSERKRKCPDQLPGKMFVKDCPAHQKRILIYDFGIKRGIIKMLERLDCHVNVVPGYLSAEEILACRPDGIIFSNGPGDPLAFGDRIEEIRKLIYSRLPILGICLGCQFIAIAGGARTKKLTFGHHGVNHPVYDLSKKKVYVTSQNHNYVVDEEALPSHFEVTHISLLDGSVQGIKLKDYPVVGFQGHPEGSPGPEDMKEIVTEFLEKAGLIHALRSSN